jgi:hypothetical protein
MLDHEIQVSFSSVQAGYWAQPASYAHGYQGRIRREQTDHLPPVARLRMHGAITPLPYTSLW